MIGWRTESERSIQSWDDWLAAQDGSEPSPDRPGARIIFYTSGTTGFPKGTLSRLPGMPETVRGVVDVWLRDLNVTVGPNLRRLMNVGPMHHIAPLGSCIGGTLACGLVALPRFDARDVLETIQCEKVGSTVMVPTHLRRLLQLPSDVRDAFDVSSVELIGLTGAACPVDVKQAVIDWFGPVVIEAYGATEAGALCRIDSHEWLAHRGSVGRCLPDFEPVVLDAEDRPLARGQVGRLYFRDRLGIGIDYRNAPEKTAAAHLEPGVFTIGDVGYVDGEGYVYITDRAVDMIVSGGVNVYPAEAERVLLGHPEVHDVAIIAVPDDDLGERAHALIELDGRHRARCRGRARVLPRPISRTTSARARSSSCSRSDEPRWASSTSARCARRTGRAIERSEADRAHDRRHVEQSRGELVAGHILDAVAAKAGAPFLLGCPAGRTPVTTYDGLGALAAQRRIDLSKVKIVMLDEYVVDGTELCDPEAHYSCRRFIREHLVGSAVEASQVHWPDASSPGAYDESIERAGGLDVAILGCGTSDGHVAFNPPGTDPDSPTRVVRLADSTRRDNLATFPKFAALDEVPRAGATMGLRTIRAARSTVLMLLGQAKSTAWARLTSSDTFDPEWPASVIHLCRSGWLVADEGAAGRQ